MESILQLFNLDFPALFTGIFLILSSIIAAVSMIGKFSELIGKPVTWIAKKNADHELLLTTVQSLQILQQKHEDSVTQSIRHDDIIRNDLKKLTDMFIEKQIEDYRWDIINFATRVAAGQPCNKDSYKHCLRTYERYEKLLEENELENGEVEISMEIINESYKEKLKHGF